MDHKYVFISYSSANKAIADATCHILEECGIPCWIAPRNIIPGKTWAGNIVQAIRDCSLMVLIYSEESNSSSQVANEVDRAFSHGKTIIPFMVDTTPMNDDFDYYLSRKHWLVAYPDYKKMLMPLVEAVATNLGIEITPPEKNSPVEEAKTSGETVKEAGSGNPMFEASLEIARKALLNYELDIAFAELIGPALENCEEAQFMIRIIFSTFPRMQKLDSLRFKYIKEQADSGNAFAQYMMSRYYSCKEMNPGECFRYARLCSEQNKTYGYQAMARCYEIGIGVDVDNARNIELLDKASNMGDPFAMLRLAKDNLYGWSRKCNPKRAFILLKRCMETGLPESFIVTGDMYNEGNGVEHDGIRALELYNKALDMGYLEAYNSIAWFHIADMVKLQYKNDDEIKKGISLLRKGIDRGVATCLSSLASCYQEGTGVEKKADQAFRWYKKAAEMGDSGSFYQVGHMYYYGEGCQENNAEAWKWLVRGSQIPNGSCDYLLGIMCQDGYGQEGKTEADCVGYYERSLYLGGAYSCESAMKLYNIFRTRSLETDPLMRDDTEFRDYDWAQKDNRRAVGYLKRATEIDNNDPEVHFKYGAILSAEGNGFTDEFEGIEHLKIAAGKGHARAAVMLAHIYENSGVVEKDLEQAREYYRMAADKDCGDGYAGLAKDLCLQITDDMDKSESEKILNKEAEKELIHKAYGYVCKADELKCNGGSPLEDTFMAFMLKGDLLGQEERNRLVAINEKYARAGNIQSIVDSGVIYQMGQLAEPDPAKAIEAYILAARLGKECAAKNLGDLFCGKEVALPEKQLSKQTAAYWYDKDKSDNSKQEYKTLMQEGHEYVCQAESITNTEKRTEAIKWVFPYLCDPAFGPESPGFLIFDWSDFTDGPVADSIPENLDSEIRYLPESLNDFFKAYKELSDSLAGVSGWDESMMPLLDKEDFFPYLSITNFRKIANMSYEVWYSLVKHGKGEWLEQHKDELEKLTLMETDWEKILDFAEKCPDTDLQMVLICLVETCYEMDNAAETYWKLFALNRLVENSGNEDCRLPDYFVKDFADRFSTGTEVLPRSHAIASRLYRQVIHMPGAEESLKRLSNL